MTPKTFSKRPSSKRDVHSWITTSSSRRARSANKCQTWHGALPQDPITAPLRAPTHARCAGDCDAQPPGAPPCFAVGSRHTSCVHKALLLVNVTTRCGIFGERVRRQELRQGVEQGVGELLLTRCTRSRRELLRRDLLTKLFKGVSLFGHKS